jgi:hypothetical protein
MTRVELNRVLVQDCGDKNRDIYIYKAKPKKKETPKEISFIIYV